MPPRGSRRSPFATAVQALGEILLTLGVVVFLFVAYEMVWTDRETHHAQRELDRRFGEQRQQVPKRGDPVAVLEMPRLGKDWRFVVVQGTGLEQLKRGPGHLPKTALPGKVGNFAVAGHRVTYMHPFYDLGTARKGDKIYVTTHKARYTYTVTQKLVVAPTQTDVKAPTPGHPGVRPTKRMLTFIACHPKYSARQRLIVHGELTATSTVPKGRP